MKSNRQGESSELNQENEHENTIKDEGLSNTGDVQSQQDQSEQPDVPYVHLQSSLPIPIPARKKPQVIPTTLEANSALTNLMFWEEKQTFFDKHTKNKRAKNLKQSGKVSTNQRFNKS